MPATVACDPSAGKTITRGPLRLAGQPVQAQGETPTQTIRWRMLTHVEAHSHTYHVHMYTIPHTTYTHTPKQNLTLYEKIEKSILEKKKVY